MTVGDGAKYKTAHQYRIDRRTGTLRISESSSFASENTLAANKHKAECPAATKNSSIPKQKCENMMCNCIYSYSKTDRLSGIKIKHMFSQDKYKSRINPLKQIYLNDT